MTVKITQTSILDKTGGNHAFAVSSLLTLTAAQNPAYIVVNALDRNEYTAAATGKTGHFTGANNTMLTLAAIGSDGRGAGIVYTWQASTGQYVNATYGTLSQLNYVDSTSAGDVSNLSVFGTSSNAQAQAYAANAYALMQTDASGYLGSTTFVTAANAAATQATPDGIAAAAMAMVGHAWNMEGCWVLASTIAAEAGAGLPVQSTALHQAGAANGEWIPIYNGPVASGANWQSLVSTGDMVAFATSATSGHITTCVSGSGASAMLVDNIAYLGAFGRLANAANDGSPNDVTIAAPHAAAEEFSGVAANSVVIYALDIPTVTAKAPATIATNAKISLATLFSATDPAHNAITSYQVYQQGTGDTLQLNGLSIAAISAATALTTSSLANLTLLAGTVAHTDTLEVRASNGTYWGDWDKLTLAIGSSAVASSAFSAPTAAVAATVSQTPGTGVGGFVLQEHPTTLFAFHHG